MAPHQDASTASLIKLLSNPSNLELLLLLSTKPSYTRELARLSGKNETEVSRRLRILEKAGIVKGEWKRIEGKSVRVYRLAVSELHLKIRDGQLIVYAGPGMGARPLRVRLATNRPPRVGLLVGRSREEEIIRSPPTPVIVVWGISGIGKTSLVAHALADEPKVFWHTSTRMESAEYLLWRLGLFLSSLGSPELLNYLGSPRANPEFAVDVAIESLRGTDARLVFDDFHEVEGSLAGDIIARLCQEADSYYVYVISRVRPRGLRGVPQDKKTELFLTGLDFDASLELLRALGARLPREQAVKAYNVTSGHPLLLTLLAKTAESSLERLRGLTVEYLWEEVYASLSPRERRILLALSAFDEPIPVDLISSLTGILDPSPYLYRLRDKGMVETYESGFRAHQLVRYFLGNVDKKRYLVKAANYFRSLGGWPGRMKAIRYYMAGGEAERAAEIVAERVRNDDYNYISHVHAYTSLIEELSQHKVSPKLQVYVQHDLALVRRMQSRLSESLEIIDNALQLVQLAGDPVAEAALRSERSYILADLARPEEAEKEARKAIELARSAGNPYILFGALANLAKALAVDNRFEETLDVIMEEYRLAASIGDPFYIIWARIHLAEAYRLLGELDKAKEHLEYVLKVSEELGLTYPMFFVSLVYSSVLEEEGDWKGLLEWASRAEKLLMELGIGHRSCRPKYFRARALAGLGRREEALLEARWALDIAERSEDVAAAERLREMIRELERD